MMERDCFTAKQLEVVNEAAQMAEELVSNHYKMSASQWLHRRYDIRTLADLTPAEIVSGPFAQIVRYEGIQRDQSLGSAVYDLYKICLQDHAIRKTLQENAHLQLLPFMLYIITHELIHIVRFSSFQQYFNAPAEERVSEEKRVHARTHEILEPVRVQGLADVLEFYSEWRIPYDEYGN
jgi:hypothetical protein